MKYLFLSLIVFTTYLLTGQERIQLLDDGPGFYKYGERDDRLHNFGDLFENIEQAETFELFNKYRKRQSTANYVALGLLTVSVGAAIIIGNGGHEVADIIGSIAVAGGGTAISLLTFIIGNATSGSKKGRYKKILLTGEDPKGEVGYRNQGKLIATPNGICLVYSF